MILFISSSVLLLFSLAFFNIEFFHFYSFLKLRKSHFVCEKTIKWKLNSFNRSPSSSFDLMALSRTSEWSPDFRWHLKCLSLENGGFAFESVKSNAFHARMSAESRFRRRFITASPPWHTASPLQYWELCRLFQKLSQAWLFHVHGRFRNVSWIRARVIRQCIKEVHKEGKERISCTSFQIRLLLETIFSKMFILVISNSIFYC